jgi:hypothetical protein
MATPIKNFPFKASLSEFSDLRSPAMQSANKIVIRRDITK